MWNELCSAPGAEGQFQGRLNPTQSACVLNLSRLSPGDLLPLLLMAHFLCDFGLQSDRMAREKCPGGDSTLPWGWWLTAHAAIHGLAVALLTGVPGLGLAEMAVHAWIDHAKCAGRISLRVDQLLHMMCKGLWVLILAAG
ncbi:MAG: DUF3307 domain-containing protein [Cyanobacteria bacterium K_Offshore_surface_m2_239]|nr:DUF3307 domain-containing protein [Cyanobacteria bacterium K_Offshore_surface_m2_239]